MAFSFIAARLVDEAPRDGALTLGLLLIGSAILLMLQRTLISNDNEEAIQPQNCAVQHCASPYRLDTFPTASGRLAA
jgi:hypothetical protein